MRYVILRDDDTNALTPIECLEQLYRPFLDRNLPVNLATIPDVFTRTTLPDGQLEGFLAYADTNTEEKTRTIGSNRSLVEYLQENPGYYIVQHGLHHDRFEFDRADRVEVRRRFARGTELLQEAGFRTPKTFVAPHDKFTSVSLQEAANHFSVVSSGWYEKGRLPASWWPRYLLKKISGARHWRIDETLLLSHPGCLLARRHLESDILENVKLAVANQPLTVLVTHWWEYFPDRKPDAVFIQQLHAVADFLASDSNIKVIAFDELVDKELGQALI